MQWRSLTDDEKFNQRISRECHWHKWFAWYPVKIKCNETNYSRAHWLEYVGRKKRIDTSWDEYIPSTHIGNPQYCSLDDLVYNVLVNNEIIDNR